MATGSRSAAWLVASAACSAAPVRPIIANAAPPLTADARPLDATALDELLRDVFPAAIEAGTLELQTENETARNELAAMGITTTRALAAIIPADYADRAFELDPTTTLGLVRDLLIIADAERYFAEVFANDWSAECPDGFLVPLAYGIDLALIRAAGACAGD